MASLTRKKPVNPAKEKRRLERYAAKQTRRLAKLDRKGQQKFAEFLDTASLNDIRAELEDPAKRALAVAYADGALTTASKLQQHYKKYGTKEKGAHALTASFRDARRLARLVLAFHEQSLLLRMQVVELGRGVDQLTQEIAALSPAPDGTGEEE